MADKTLSADQREAIPRNFLLFVGSHFLTKLGDALSNPKTTLTWLAGTLGVPGWMISLLVPIRESGSMLLQVWMARHVQRFRQRKWAWSLGAVLQALSMFGIALAAWQLRGTVAGLVLLTLLALYALARSISSIASKDVLARTLPKGTRGRATGWAAGAAGLATLGIGMVVTVLGPKQLQAGGYALVLLGAGMLWLLAAALFATTREPTAEGHGASQPVRLRLLLQDARLRQFVLARALLMCTALSAPYYDRSSRVVMMVGGAAGATLGALLAVAMLWSPGLLGQVWLMPAMYFVLSLAHQAVRIGRKTYVVDIATGNTRIAYVAVSYAAIGVLPFATSRVQASSVRTCAWLISAKIRLPPTMLPASVGRAKSKT
jgi:MFS family permease